MVSRFEVTFAVWGALKTSPGGEMSASDVADTLNGQIGLSDVNSVKIDNTNMGGDAAKGSRKHFAALVSVDGGEPRPFACVEGQTIQFAETFLPRSEPGRYKVLHAVYGAQLDGSIHYSSAVRDVTFALQQSLNLTTDGLVAIDNTTMGGDPAIFTRKHFAAKVEVDGISRLFACVEGQTIDFVSTPS